MMKIKDLNSIFWSIARYHLFNKKTPLSVTVNLTYRCNLNCIYCNVENLIGDEMSTGQIYGLIDQFYSSGCRRIGFAGGEPLVRKDIGKPNTLILGFD